MTGEEEENDDGWFRLSDWLDVCCTELVTVTPDA
jgi:hypothetical protein